MKHFILLLAAVACTVSCTSKEPFTIGKGVNISHWLSQSDARATPVATTSHATM